MKEQKELFVLVVAADRVIAATLATVLRSDGYMVATTASGATASRIAGRMIIDAAVIDLATDIPMGLEIAVTLQNRYPDCRLVLVCSPSQKDEAVMRAEESGLDCELILRPLSRAELLAQLATAPGVEFNPQTAAKQLLVA
ncbi:MAG TPA: response regulator [Terriglobales bacterium]|jgi:DNA-binding response OmpR family regulator|nr:response regulator [Terriglobales bacterium]